MIKNKTMSQDEMLAFLHQVHNKIRNANGIKLTGLPALNEINNFFALYFIRDKVVDEGLGEECIFDNIYEKYATDECIKHDRKLSITELEKTYSYKLWYNVFSAGNATKCVLKKILENRHFKKYFDSDINKTSSYSSSHKTHETIQEIINMFYKKFKGVEISYKVFDTLGAAYEKFKTDEISNSGKNTGQHFTPVAIKKIIIDELKPKYSENYYEPCSGSGGFIHTACHYIFDTDEKNIKKFKKNIYANEINPELQKPLMINMLLHDIPIKNINVDNECDSLSNQNCRRYIDKMDVCATNVPFGVKTYLLKDSYWEPIVTGKNVIKESTPQFIVHIYNSLKKTGRAGVVIDRGLLNNGSDGNTWQKKFRKWILTNTNLYKIILIPTGMFDYTNFATAIIFFNKGETTENVEFYEAKCEDNKKKDKLIIDEKPIKILNIKEIEKNNWALKYDWITEEIDETNSFVKIKDIVDIQKKKNKYKASDGMISGIYNFYTCGEKILHRDDYEFNDECIIINGGGCANIRIDKQFNVSNDLHVISAKPTKYLNKLIYYYLKINKHILQNNMHGSGLKHLSQANLLNIQIPNLNLSIQEEIIKVLDSVFGMYDINLIHEYTKDIKLFNLLLCKQYNMFSDAIHIIYRKMETDELIKKMELDKKAIFNFELVKYEYENVELKDIVKTLNLKISKIENSNKTGEYPFYNCSIVGHLQCDEWKYNDEVILLNKTNGTGKAKVFYNNGKFNLSGGVVVMKVNIKNYPLFVYHNLNYNIHLVEKYYYGSDKKNIKLSDLLKVQIKLPSIENQKVIIEKINKLTEIQLEHKKYSDELQEIINGISEYITNAVTIIVDEPIYKTDDERDTEHNEETDDECDTEHDKETDDEHDKKCDDKKEKNDRKIKKDEKKEKKDKKHKEKSDDKYYKNKSTCDISDNDTDNKPKKHKK